jgi:hypothetical protein
MSFGGGGGKAPAPPQYIPNGPAPSYVTPPDPQGVVPPALSGKQVIQQGNYLEGFTTTNKKGKVVGLDQVPVNLRLDKDPLSHEVIDPYATAFYQQQINPQIQQARADLSQNGGSYGSYGGARVGQIEAEGQLAKFQAGLSAAQQVYNNTLAGRESYFNGAPKIVQTQNALDVTRGLGVAGIQSQNYDSQNDFNQGIFGITTGSNNNHNDFNSNNYSTQSQNYRSQQQNSGLGGIFGGLAQGIIGGII